MDSRRTLRGGLMALGMIGLVLFMIFWPISKWPCVNLAVLGILLAMTLYACRSDQSRRKTRHCDLTVAGFSLIFALMMVCGKRIVMTGGVADSYSLNYFRSFEITDIFYFFTAFAAACLVSYLAVLYGPELLSKLEMAAVRMPPALEGSMGEKKGQRVFFLLSLAGLMIPWFIGFLYHYPGTIIYADVLQILNVGPQEASNISPIWFNYVVWFFLHQGVSSGHPNRGVALFCLVQMLMFAVMTAAVLTWMRKRGAGLFWIILAFLFYAFYPIIGLYSYSMLKDAWYSYAIFLWIPFLFDVVHTRKFSRHSAEALGALLFFTIASRNNGLMVGALMVPVLMVLCRKYWKRILLTGMGTILVVSLAGRAISGNVQHRFAETVGIPLQQIGMVMQCGGNLSEEDKSFLFQILPEEEWVGDDAVDRKGYAPFCSDTLKYNADGKFNSDFLDSHRMEFVRVYLRVLTKNPGLCLKAWLMATCGFWKVGEVNDLQAYVTGIEENDYGIARQSRLPAWLDNLVGQFYSFVPSSEGSGGNFIWIILLICLIFLLNHKAGYAAVLLPVVLNWLTLMAATPIAFAFRYVYYYLLILPLLLPLMQLAFRKERGERKWIK